MLLTALHADADQSDAVRVGPASLSRHALLGAAAAVSAEVAGATAIAVHADASLETVVTVVGCLLAGVPVVPVPADAGPAERAHVLSDSRAQQWWGPRPDDVRVERRTADLSARGNPPPEPPAGATALVLYTSGTTGPPKGVLLSRAAVMHGLDALVDAWAWTPDDVLVHGLPLFHVHGLVLGVLGALRVGSPLVHTVRPTPAAYAAARGSLYFGVPTVWGRIAGDPAAARALSAARLLVSGSAALPQPVFNALRELTGHAPVERYGMSETLITLSTRADGPRRPGVVGTPVAGVRTRLVAEDGEPGSAVGERTGELQVSGPMMFDGYLNRPDATATAWTEDGWFRTGDVVSIDHDGTHRIVGRASIDLIKTGGYRVGAGEVEAALLTHPDVIEAAVVGVPDADLGQRIVAYVVGVGLDVEELVGLVASTLSFHKRPREVRVVDALPRNAMGKVQKAQLG